MTPEEASFRLLAVRGDTRRTPAGGAKTEPHPVVRQLVRRLVCRSDDGTFRVTEEQDFADEADARCAIAVPSADASAAELATM